MSEKGHTKARLLTMDELQARPCEVDGRPALFHRWVEEDDALLQIPPYAPAEIIERIVRLFSDQGIATGGCEIMVAHHTFALVEYRDGTVAEVDPELIHFTDKEGMA